MNRVHRSLSLWVRKPFQFIRCRGVSAYWTTAFKQSYNILHIQYCSRYAYTHKTWEGIWRGSKKNDGGSNGRRPNRWLYAAGSGLERMLLSYGIYASLATGPAAAPVYRRSRYSPALCLICLIFSVGSLVRAFLFHLHPIQILVLISHRNASRFAVKFLRGRVCYIGLNIDRLKFLSYFLPASSID